MLQSLGRRVRHGLATEQLLSGPLIPIFQLLLLALGLLIASRYRCVFTGDAVVNDAEAVHILTRLSLREV